MESVSLYSEARTEYLKQLSIWIIPPLVEFFIKEYNSITPRDTNRAMAIFQKYCEEVPRWNQDVIETNIGVILDNCRCDYVEELMTAVFIAHTKMLTAIRVSTRNKKLQITLPKLDHFLHRVFVECARMFWKAPYLFADELPPIEKQKNILQAESMCTEALSGAVRSLLPVKSILKDYLEEDDEEEDVEVKEKKVVEAEKVVKAVEALEADTVVETGKASEADMVVETGKALEADTVVETGKALEADTVVETGKPVEEALNESVKSIDLGKEQVNPTIEKQTEATPKAPAITIEKVQDSAIPSLNIETEPVVHFTPYDTVFDDRTASVSEIRYTPKVSVEDKTSSWGDELGPKLTIGADAGASIVNSDILELEPSTVLTVPTTDIDIPLTSSADFEELA